MDGWMDELPSRHIEISLEREKLFLVTMYFSTNVYFGKTIPCNDLICQQTQHNVMCVQHKKVFLSDVDHFGVA